MALAHSPRIVTDGLVLYLDAANTKSYVSGSTTWSDLSRSENSATLINGPTYSNANKGSIILVLDFYVNTITDSMSIDELLWELQVVVQDILGKGRVKLVHNETINTRQNRQW
jgi:hypothetical protein